MPCLVTLLIDLLMDIKDSHENTKGGDRQDGSTENGSCCVTICSAILFLQHHVLDSADDTVLNVCSTLHTNKTERKTYFVF